MFNSVSPSQHGAPAPSRQMPAASTGMEELAGNDGAEPVLKSRQEQACARAGTGSFRKGRGEDMATAAAQDGSQDGGRDLTGRARIRNAGLHLIAANRFAGTPLRAIPAEAGAAVAPA